MNTFNVLFDNIYKGNRQASELSFLLLNIVHTWDDLVDKDKPVSEAQINRAFLDATVRLTMNPLWDSHIASNFMNVYLRWSTANAIERDNASTHNDLAKAWMLRASVYDIFVLIAHKLYGIEWAEEVGPVVHKYYGETLSDFIKEMRHA